MSQQLIDAAKASVIAYNNKDWNAVRAAVAPGFIYDEVGTRRKTQGVDETIAIWQGWAAAMPDSRATFQKALVDGNSVVLEITWQGTHTGPLETPSGPIAATGKPFHLRACQVVEIADGKAQSVRHYFDLASLLEQLGVGR